MTDPVLVEESTILRLASSLEDLAKTLGKDAAHHDYMMALVIVVMVETGFSVTTSNPSETDPRYKRKPRIIIPPDWKSTESGNYTVKFSLHQASDQECKILGIPNGDMLVINLILPNEFKKVFSIAVQTVKYVNIYSSDISGRYLNLREFSFRFKNTMTTPARCEILLAAGIAHSSLSGLPAEIKVKIIDMLDTRSLARIAQTSKEFRELSGDAKIRKNIHQRYFPNVFNPRVDDYPESYYGRGNIVLPFMGRMSHTISLPFEDYHCF